MSVHFLLRIEELGDGCVLAGERFDPRSLMRATTGSDPRLDELVQICSDSVRPTGASPARHESAALVLDTTHAYEGFVIARHRPEPLGALASSKRVLQPGDVIVSRLRPYLRQVAFVDEGLFHLLPDGNRVLASSEFFVLRRRSRVDGSPASDLPIDPAGLIPFLLCPAVQQALAAGQEGGHHPRFRRDLLAALRVPTAVVQQIPSLAARLQAHAQAVRAALRDSVAMALAVERCGPDPAAVDPEGIESPRDERQ